MEDAEGPLQELRCVDIACLLLVLDTVVRRRRLCTHALVVAAHRVVGGAGPRPRALARRRVDQARQLVAHRALVHQLPQDRDVLVLQALVAPAQESVEREGLLPLLGRAEQSKQQLAQLDGTVERLWVLPLSQERQHRHKQRLGRLAVHEVARKHVEKDWHQLPRDALRGGRQRVRRQRLPQAYKHLRLVVAVLRLLIARTLVQQDVQRAVRLCQALDVSLQRGAVLVDMVVARLVLVTRLHGHLTCTVTRRVLACVVRVCRGLHRADVAVAHGAQEGGLQSCQVWREDGPEGGRARRGLASQQLDGLRPETAEGRLKHTEQKRAGHGLEHLHACVHGRSSQRGADALVEAREVEQGPAVAVEHDVVLVGGERQSDGLVDTGAQVEVAHEPAQQTKRRVSLPALVG
eukprot:Unigene11883_Nuclearia_a/m.36183 Unigene11883_Nuclearia_a/g.36183  ORF Unigene11883_Nuclearia_a/g.36183 Unigene11883_Nuclearia_a/m.36183 type:complete len:406 (-) Unigene11883_Nuclearia_a:822-2039(-)